MHNNLCACYYLDQQQQGHGMPVFRGSLWQAGHGQHGYGLGDLFRSIATGANLCTDRKRIEKNAEDVNRKNPQDVNRRDKQLKRERRPRPGSEAVQPRD